MNKIMLILGVSMMLSGLAGAHQHKSLVNIEKAHKVIIKTGMSKHDKVMMFKCLVMVKKHKTVDAAMEFTMAKIKERCERDKMDEKKCEKIKHKVAKKIAGCFAINSFMNEFFGRTEAAAPESK